MRALQEAHTQSLRKAEPPVFLMELLTSIFPQLYKAMGPSPWQLLITRFFHEHPIRTPIMHEIPEEFVGYLYYHAEKEWFELAHFEWVEMALYFDPTDLTILSFSENTPVVSPLAYLLNYETFEQSHWLAHRNKAHQVFYTPVDLFGAQFFELLKKNTTLSVQAVIKQLASETQDKASALIDEWRKKDIILG